MSNSSNTGSYAVTTVSVMPWLKKKPRVKNIKTSTRQPKKIIHEIFKECAELSEDPYWTSIFNDCSFGKFPRGFSYQNSLLIYKKGNKLKRLCITSSVPETYTNCIDFFKLTAGLMSSRDRERLRDEDEERMLQKMEQETQWKDIKIEKVRSLMISDYVTKLAEEYEYNNEEKKELATTIKIGFMLKIFKHEDIILETRRIVDIKGLNYNEETHKFELDWTRSNRKPTKYYGLGIEETISKPAVSFIDTWVKYLNSLNPQSKSKTTTATKSNSKSKSESYDNISTSYDIST